MSSSWCDLHGDKIAYLCSFFRLNRLSPNIATMMVRVPDVMRNTGTTKNSCKKNMNEIVMSCHTMVPICMGESKNAKPKQTVLILHHKRKNFYHNINNRHELPTM